MHEHIFYGYPTFGLPRVARFMQTNKSSISETAQTDFTSRLNVLNLFEEKLCYEAKDVPL